MSQDRPNLETIVEDLVELGLSKDTAKVYVALLRTGRSPANAIAKVAGVHRVDTYKKLKELTRLGFGKLIIERPTLYEPVDPKTVLEALINTKRRKLEHVMESGARLEATLRALSSTVQVTQLDDGQSAYQVIVGRKQGYNMMAKALQSARYEVQRIISPNGLKRNYKYKLLDEHVACTKRGVRVRIITNAEHLPAKILKLVQPSIELRHSPDSLLPTLVVDGETVILSSQFNDSDMSLDSQNTRTVLIKDKKFAKLFLVVFEHFWSSAKQVEK
jgi:sugar-specific transcriptional regulator TrmB